MSDKLRWTKDDALLELDPIFTKADLIKLRSNWLEAITLTKLPTLNTLRVALRLHHHSGQSDSVSRFLRNKKLYAFPSVARLARDLGISENAVRRSIRNLEAAGLIYTTESRGGRGRNRSNRYRLLPQRLSRIRTRHDDDSEAD